MLYWKKAFASLTLRSDGNWLAATSENKLFVMSMDGVVVKHAHATSLLAVCFHPIDDVLCTSDAMGRIILWFGYRHPTVRRRSSPCTRRRRRRPWRR